MKKEKKRKKDKHERESRNVRATKGKAAKRTPRAPGRAPQAPRAPGLGAALRALDERIASRERRIEEAKREFELAAKALRVVVAEQAEKVEPGPRRFRSTPTRSREIQRTMTDLAVEMRILAARRAELQWLQQLLGETS